MRKKRLQWMGCIACALLLALNGSAPMQSLRRVERDIYVREASDLASLAELQAPFSIREDARSVSAQYAQRLYARETQREMVTLFGVVPLKEVTLHYRPQIYLVPGGQSIGVSLHMQGALVVGLGSFMGEDGEMTSPAQAAGVKAGDIIEAANGVAVRDAAHLVAMCDAAQGALTLSIRRDEKRLEVRATPVKAAEDGLFKLGMWVRDSTAGIGTLSFFDEQSRTFGALGHPITDVDVGSVIEIGEGEISTAQVVGVSSGAQGAPGELHGALGKAVGIGRLENNTNFGIFGQLYQNMENPLYPDGLPLAYPDEVHTGEAWILTTVDSEGVCAFRCEITRVYMQEQAENKGIVVHITDEALLASTGGIVQGMSGSPLIQDGKLAGIVTHVFVNDPTRGYAVYAYWMYETAIS